MIPRFKKLLLQQLNLPPLFLLYHACQGVLGVLGNMCANNIFLYLVEFLCNLVMAHLIAKVIEVRAKKKVRIIRNIGKTL